MVEDAEVGEQFAVIPMQEGEQELSVDAGGDDDIGVQPDDGISSFSAITVPYHTEPEVTIGYRW